MEITFANDNLAKMCSTEEGLVKCFGEEFAGTAGTIIIALYSAESIADIPTLPPENRRLIVVNDLPVFSVNVTDGIHIIFCAVGLNDGDYKSAEKLAGVRTIEIQRIEGVVR